MGKEEPVKTILAIDDQLSHLQIVEQVLTESATACRLVAISAPDDAIDFLHQRGQYLDAQRPALILLDLHLANGAGERILNDVKTEPILRRIPVIVLTDLAEIPEVLRSYQQRCNCYVIKPQDQKHLSQVVEAIEAFWLNIVTLPNN
ncbi:MAG: response regulator [Cyanobacteria bacterium J06628_6]